jgi:hypothetical protein
MKPILKTTLAMSPLIAFLALDLFSTFVIEDYIRSMGFRPKDTNLVTIMAGVGYLVGYAGGWIIYEVLPRIEKDK